MSSRGANPTYTQPTILRGMLLKANLNLIVACSYNQTFSTRIWIHSFIHSFTCKEVLFHIVRFLSNLGSTKEENWKKYLHRQALYALHIWKMYLVWTKLGLCSSSWNAVTIPEWCCMFPHSTRTGQMMCWKNSNYTPISTTLEPTVQNHTH